jgi:hypothetical protein
MRRSLAVPIAALIGAASAAPISLAAASPRLTTLAAPSVRTVEERYGVVRYDAGAHRWAILSTPTFQSSGLTSVSCSSGSGTLTVAFTPLTSIGTFTVDEDEAYAGRYDAGAAPTVRSLAITFRRAGSGAVVSCNDSELRIANSSLQLWVRGALVSTPPPTTQPTPPTSQPPTTQPTLTTPPTSQPPTTQPPTTQPPTISVDPDD